jgi:hypothetical protein
LTQRSNGVGGGWNLQCSRPGVVVDVTADAFLPPNLLGAYPVLPA